MFIAVALAAVRDIVMLFFLCSACAHLNEIAEHAKDLTAINFHAAEIRRRMHGLESLAKFKGAKRTARSGPVIETERKDD